MTINGETVEEAIQKGCQQLDLSQDQVNIRIINEGKKGFLGFGRQDAIVEISAKDQTSISEMIDDSYEHQVSNRSIDKNSNEEFTVDSPQLKNNSNDDSLENQLFDQEESQEKTVLISSENTQKSQTEDDIEEDETDDALSESSSTENEFQSLEAASDIVASYLINTIEEYGAEASIDFNVQGKNVIFNIDTDKSGLIIGKHGKIINSLQILAQTLLHHHYKHRAFVTLNVGDYRDRRAEILEKMAQRTADDVLKSKQPVILDSLPAYERKQIHAYLSKIDHISTHSEGKDPNRYLVVEYINE